MERRKFLFFLPTLVVAPKVFVEVMTSVPDVLNETSTVFGGDVFTGKSLGLTESQIIARELELVNQHLPTLFDRDDVFFSAIERAPMMISSRLMRVPLQLKPGGQFGANPIIVLENAINRVGNKITAEAQKVIDDLNRDLADEPDYIEDEDD